MSAELVDESQTQGYFDIDGVKVPDMRMWISEESVRQQRLGELIAYFDDLYGPVPEEALKWVDEAMAKADAEAGYVG